MIQQKIIKVALLFICVLSINSYVAAQNTISPEKKKLITELISLTKAGVQAAEISDTMLDSMERTYPIILKQSLKSSGQLSQSEQDKFSDRLTLSFKTFSRRFREELPAVIDYEKYVNDMVYPLYDKYFTAKELADLVAFYKTETGQKIVTTMPQLVVESTKISETLLVPKLIKLADKLIQEEIKNLEREIVKEDG